MIGCTPRRQRAFALVLILLLSASARGEDKPSVTLNGESRAAALRLAQLRERLDEKKWSEAIEELQTILTTAGNDLVALTPTDRTPTHSVQVRRLCQVELAALPAEALRLYRQRYEAQAQKNLRQARTERDVPQLRKLVEDAFCTRAAEKAIDLLGDLAFERGRFDEAEEWWRLLAPLPDARRDAVPSGLKLVYPDPRLEPARLQAKQLLARLFRGSDGAWTEELDAYRHRYAKADGTLAGRKGRYGDVLLALAQQRKKEGAQHADWPTFAGAASRGRIVSAPQDVLDHLSALCREGPTWRFNLEERTRQRDAAAAPAVSAAQARTLAFFPVLVGHQLLVADARHVTAFDLRDGTSQQWYDVAAVNGGVEPNLKLPAPPDLRYTLTVADENVYVRLGAQDIGVEAPAAPPHLGQALQPRRDNETFLACLSLRPDRQDEHFRWQIRGIDREPFFFEGTPLVADGLIWIATTCYRGEHCVTALDCYAADDSSKPPLRWRREVCETPLPKAGQPRYRHQLLTRAGTQIVYCTHNGAVVAVDALTGRTNWAVRYRQRKGVPNDRELRDLAPVLFAEGRLYVAPADAEGLLCLDAATGRTLWEVESLSVVHLLGVAGGRLMFTTPTGLRAVKADNGDPLWSFPQAGALTPAGRGLLIGDLLLFPTTQKRHPTSPTVETVVYVVRQQDGRAADDPAQLPHLPGGNLLYANGCLVVADRRTLTVFVPPELRRGQRKSELPRFQQQQQLIEQARRAIRDERADDADSDFRRAIELSSSPRSRLHVLLRAARIWQDAGQLTRSRAVWERIRADETLRSIQVIDRKGKPASAADSAAVALALLGGERRPVRLPAEAGLRLSAKPQAAQTLPLFRTWQAHLRFDEWILAGWQTSDPELLLTGSADGRFTCRLTSTGDIRWQHRLPFGPRWAACHANLLLVGGDDGIAGLQRDDGKLLWHFPAPAPGRYPRAAVDEVRVIVDPQPPEPLTTFRLAAGRVFCLQGQRRLFAIRADSGVVLWDRWAPDGELRLPFPRGCFSPCYHAGAETVLIQMAGRRWLLDAATGRQIHEAADSRDLWRRPPLQLDERTLGVTPDSRHVVLLDARTGQSLWTHRPAGNTTLSGEPPFLLGRGEVLLCVKPANIGYFLQRLDRAYGKPVWTRPQLLTMKILDPSAWTFDAEAVYSVEDESLTARALADGRELWRRPLANAGWQVRRVGDYLLLHPSASATEARLRFRSPLASVQWDIGSLLAPETICPLSCYDPKTGQLVQRLNFRLAAPPRTTPATRIISEEGGRFWRVRTSSLLASEEGAVMRLASPQPLVAVGGEVWGLTSASGGR